MKIDQVSIDKIKPYFKNAKKHPEVQIEQIAKSIQKFGFNQPIVVDTNFIIIVGHGRLEAAKLLELTEVPVYMIDIPEAEARAYRLADNKLNESDWDMDLVYDELKQLEKIDINIVPLTGFDICKVEVMLEDADGKGDVDENYSDELQDETKTHCVTIEIKLYDDYKDNLLTFLEENGIEYKEQE